ncbi:MAG: hypothetical protein Q7J35_14135 [Candidatus Methanoperedens sp.]|nr:hypothetical protein [Candidatus Methanoperedens sp.]
MKKIIYKYSPIIITIFLFILLNIPYETSIPYNATEIYNVEEPYTDFNYYNYTVTEPFIEYIPLDYNVSDAQYENYVSSPPSYLWVNINNTDMQGGNFAVDFHVSIKDEVIPLIYTISSPGYYISPGETRTIKVSLNQTIKEFKYDIIPPTKEITKYRNVTKQRTETKYRTVQRTRQVVKFRIERLSLFERIFNA